MPEFIISKSPALRGEVEISGSKNSALPILCAALLTEEECVISKVPPLRDVYVMLEIIKALGAKVDYDETTHTAKICANKITSTDEDYALAEKLRASFLVMGPLLARKHKAKIPMPGGCQIGTRPIDLHLKGLGEMGVKIKQEHGYVTAKCNELIGGKICLDFPSVGATENLLMAACLAKGETIIENAATEPEIVDLAEFLNKMGAKISDFGKGTITVMGVERLAGVKHTIIPDRIEAGTFMAAAVITGGDILIKNAKSDHLGAIISKLKEANAEVEVGEDTIHVYTKGEINAVDVKTMPYPGFPTDLQAVFMTLSAMAKGSSVITETVFENRFLQAGELVRMGADIKTEGRVAIVDGVKKLTGTSVKATDLRAGAALVLAALAAEGESVVSEIFHIERGYCALETKLSNLGANIKKID